MPILRKNNFSENPDNNKNSSDNSFSSPSFISTMLLLNGLVPETHFVSTKDSDSEAQKDNSPKLTKASEKREGRFAKLLEVLESKPMPVSDAGLGKIPGALFEVFPKLTRNLQNNISNSSISFFEGVFKALSKATKKDAHAMPIISMPLCYVGDPRIEEENVFYSANV